MLPYTYTQLRAALGVALALIVLVVVSISSAAPAAAQFSEIPVASVLNPDGTINTTTGVSGALDMHGWNVTLDSKRGPVLAPQGAPAVAPNAGWSAFANNGLNGTVNALAIMGSDLYVGGYFNATADGAVTNLKYIAKYSNNTWSPLAHNGLNNPVYALAVIGSDLYVGGDFIRTADSAVTNLNRIAKYSAGAWWPLANNGLKGPVHAFAVSGSDLYVGGYFTTTADDAVTNLNNIAKYTSNNTWSPLANNGLNAYVYTLALMGNDVYVGGWFDQTADGEVTNLNNIAKYSNNTWSPLANNGLNAKVFALAVSGSDLYVGGEFTATADSAVTNLNAIAKYSNNTWSPLANNGLARIGSSYWVEALMLIGSDLYVGGAFTQTDDGTMALNRIAKYTNDTWSPLANNGLMIAGGGSVHAFAVSGSDLYVGGAFTQTADGAVTNLNYIAKLTMPTCNVKPVKPKLKKPANNALVSQTKPTLKWKLTNCADTFDVTVKDATNGRTVEKGTGLSSTTLQMKLTIALKKGKTYKWFVEAKNDVGKTKSETRTFTVQ